MKKWIRTLDGEYINLDNIVELRVTTAPSDYRFQGQCVVVAESSNWSFYLWAETINNTNKDAVVRRAEMFIEALLIEVGNNENNNRKRY